MTALFYVVDTTTGVRHEPGHPDEPAALIDLATRYADLPHVDSPDRYVVEQQAVTPWAYAMPAQHANR